MENIKVKEMLSGGLLGFGGFVTLFSLFCIIYYFTGDLTKPLLPLEYLIPIFITSLGALGYSFYLQRRIRRYKQKI